jgi:hypothetical protein
MAILETFGEKRKVGFEMKNPGGFLSAMRQQFVYGHVERRKPVNGNERNTQRTKGTRVRGKYLPMVVLLTEAENRSGRGAIGSHDLAVK